MPKKPVDKRLEPKKDVDLFTEELEESLVMAGAGASGWTEERDVDKRVGEIDAEKKVSYLSPEFLKKHGIRAKKGKRRR